MTVAFRIIDVSPESIMAAAVSCATRQHSAGTGMSAAIAAKALGLKPAQAANALAMAAQLRLLSNDPSSPGVFKFTGPPEVRAAPKPGFPALFRQALQQFPPALLFVGLLSRGYGQLEAARFTVASFDIGLNEERVQRILWSWLKYAGIAKQDGSLDFEPQELLEIGFLSRLVESLRTDLATKTFVLAELGEHLAATLYKQNIDLDGFSRALQKHKSDPKDAMRESANVVESVLGPISLAAGGPGSELGKILDFLAGNARATTLKVHRNVGFGVTGLRNASDHGADPATGKHWSVTSEAALLGSLMSILLVRSISRYIADGTQEI